MRNVKNTIADYLLGMVAPHPCFNCGATGAPICSNCKSDIIKGCIRQCIFCQRDGQKALCSDHDLAYSALWLGGIRRGPLQLLVGAYKFRFMHAALTDLVEILDSSIPRLPPRTVVVPVPTLRAHIRQRGYDHALLIAEGIARRHGLKLNQCVERIGVSVQHRLKRTQRLAAAAQTFAVPQPIAEDVPYLIVDDVITTGATVNAVARALRLAGARVVWVAAVAHQPLD